MQCFCYLRNMPDKLPEGESPSARRCGAPFDGPIIPFGSDIYLKNHCLRKTKVVSIHFANIHRIRSEFWKRLDGRLGHRGLARRRELRLVRSSRQKNASPKKLDSRNCRAFLVSLCADGSLRQEGHAQCQTSRHQRVDRTHRRGRSTLHFGSEAKRDPLQCTRRDSFARRWRSCGHF